MRAALIASVVLAGLVSAHAGPALALTPVSIGGTVANQSAARATSLSPLKSVAITPSSASQNVTVTVTLSNPANGSLSVASADLTRATVSSMAGALPSNPASAASSMASAALSKPTSAAAASMARAALSKPASAAASSMASAALSKPANATVSAMASIKLSRPAVATAPSPASASPARVSLGSYNAATGVYTVTGPAAAVNAELQALIFTPTRAHGSPGQSLTTTLTITAVDAAGVTSTDSATTVVAPSLPAPPDDFNGDGRSDLLWQNVSGLLYEWQMNGTQITGGGALGTPSSSFIASGDFNGDGMADLMWQDGSGLISEWQMNGATIASSNVGVLGAWKVLAAGDFNGDGKTDLIWQYPTSGLLYEWQMNGAQIIGGGAVGTLSSAWRRLG